MANSEKLRKNKKQHVSKSLYSTAHEGKIRNIVVKMVEELNNKFEGSNFKVIHKKRLYLKELKEKIAKSYPDNFTKDIIDNDNLLNTFVSPDGGFIFLVDKDTGKEYLLLSSEAKRQGTNDIRKMQGMGKQAQGNAIERLGKNLIFIRSYMMNEEITPFVCFGYGCDFEPNSKILGRVLQMNYGLKLNKIYLDKVHNFQPVSMFFREKYWDKTEIEKVIKDITNKAINYYNTKYDLGIKVKL